MDDGGCNWTTHRASAKWLLTLLGPRGTAPSYSDESTTYWDALIDHKYTNHASDYE
jgi:hypothetical protein